MKIAVRRLREEDVEPLSVIESSSFSMPWSARDFADLLEKPYCFYLVAEADDRVVGCCGFTDLCGEGSIDNVVVAEEYRGRGIAQRMLRELLVLGEKQGICDFTLEVRVSNSAAIHVYEKLGFASEGVRPGYYGRPAEDALIMWRRRQKKPWQ